MFQLINQADEGQNVILRKKRNIFGSKELGDEIMTNEAKLCELFIENDRVDVVDFHFAGPVKMFINSEPVTEQNSELKVGDLLAVTLDDKDWSNKVKMFKLAGYDAEEGGTISSDEDQYNSDDTDTLSENGKQISAFMDLSDEIGELEINERPSLSPVVNEEPEEDEKMEEIQSQIPAAPAENPAKQDAIVEDVIEISDDERPPSPYINPKYVGSPLNHEDLKCFDECHRSDTIVELDSGSSDEPICPDDYDDFDVSEPTNGTSSSRSETGSPVGDNLFTIRTDLKKPKYKLIEMGVAYGVIPPTPPSSESDRPRAEDQTDSYNESNSESGEERITHPKKKVKRSKTMKSRPFVDSDSKSSDDECLREAAKQIERKESTSSNESHNLSLTPTPRVDPNRYNKPHATPRQTMLIEAGANPHKSFRGHKAPPIVPKQCKEGVRKVTKRKFGSPTTSKTAADIKESHRHRQNLLKSRFKQLEEEAKAKNKDDPTPSTSKEGAD